MLQKKKYKVNLKKKKTSSVESQKKKLEIWDLPQSIKM